ncbi:MAG: NAD+ kinase [Candidatus Peregrinibacteria bacterium Greene0416_19]|nr:MAG: NAD+ kinase [Candidatus Peregrinibacteria bacterium Greene0416_19]
MPYRRIGITVKSDLDHRDEAVRKVLSILDKMKVEACLDAKRCSGLPSATGLPLFEKEKDIDLLLVIGGDGTILRAVRELRDFSIPILSVNRGNIGFLAETSIDEAEQVLPKLLRGEGVIDERSVLAVRAERGKEILFDGAVLNEAVISQGSIARLVDLRTCINGEDLTTYRADGLIIATPTGSTAYSLAAGGPIVHPRLTAMILTPINSHSFSQKPIVIPGDGQVDVEVLPKQNKFSDVEVSLTLDGQTYLSLQRHDRIHVHLNERTVKFLRRKQDTFYATLRTKLKWGAGVE